MGGQMTSARPPERSYGLNWKEPERDGNNDQQRARATTMTRLTRAGVRGRIGPLPGRAGRDTGGPAESERASARQTLRGCGARASIAGSRTGCTPGRNNGQTRIPEIER